MGERHEEVDYYALLGLMPAAKLADVTAAFHSLAKRYHPDTGNDDGNRMFKLLAEAYEVLSDERKRRDYDRRLTRKVTNRAGGGEAIGPSTQPARFEPSDLELDLPISPEEARYGGTCEFVLSFDDHCLHCVGAHAALTQPCRFCQGQGWLRRREPLQIQIPPGVRGESILRLVGKGKTTDSGIRRGDLLLRLTIQPYW